MKLSTILVLVFATSLSFAAEKIKTIPMTVTAKGFEPSEIKVPAKTHVQLLVTRKVEQTCSTEIQVPSKKLKLDLPLNKTVKVDLGVLQKGEIQFGCGMEMMEGGKIFVE